MALGFEYKTGTYAVPDRQLQNTSKRSTLIASFGDGYEQRLGDGINNLKKTFQLTLANRPIEEADEILAFLNENLSLNSFDFTYKDTNEVGGESTIKVICEKCVATYINCDFVTINTSFRQVFDLD